VHISGVQKGMNPVAKMFKQKMKTSKIVKGMKVRNQYGETLTVLSVNGTAVRVREESGVFFTTSLSCFLTTLLLLIFKKI